MENGNTTLADRSGKYLTFELKGETYGLEILKVQEIIGMMNVTRVPRTEDFVRGVINLRGKVIPVVELRLKFGMESGEDTERTCIIVVQVRNHASTTTMGIIVDEVKEVVNIENDNIEDTPSFGAKTNTDFIVGVGKINQKVVMLLDVEKVMTANEIAMLESAQAHETT